MIKRQWERAQARSAIYEYLSAAFLYPEEELLEMLRGDALPIASLFHSLYGGEGGARILEFAEAVSAKSLEQVREEFTESFGHTVSTDCPPYEGEYGQAHIFLKSQSLADLAGFFGAFGLEVDPEMKDRLDHISIELEFMHFLAMKEEYALRERHGRAKVELCRGAERSFLQEHLGYWACSFAGRLAVLADGGPYGYLAGGLDQFVREEMAAYGLTVGPERPVIPEPRVDEDPSCYSCPLSVNQEMEVNVL